MTTVEKFDALEVHETKLVTTKGLKPGTFLCCEVGFAVGMIDHHIRTRAGIATYLMQDLEDGRGWIEVTFLVSQVPTIRVAV